MKKLLYIFAIAVVISSCKKSEDAAPSPLYVDMKISGNTGMTSLPGTVHFTAYIPDSADAVTWDFGDSTTAIGFSVNHIYHRYGNFNVTISGTKGSRTGTKIRTIPVTIYRKFQLNAIKILETEPYAPGSITWDPGNDKPDLMTEITFPNGDVLRPSYVLYDTDTGYFSIIPPLSTASLEGSVKIEIYDYDSTSVPDKKIMGFVSFNITDYVYATYPYPTTADIVKDKTRLRLTISWVP